MTVDTATPGRYRNTEHCETCWKDNMVPVAGRMSIGGVDSLAALTVRDLHLSSKLVPSTVPDIARVTCARGQYDLDAVGITFGSELFDCRRDASDALDGHVTGTRLMRLRSPGDSSMATRLGKNLTHEQPRYARLETEDGMNDALDDNTLWNVKSTDVRFGTRVMRQRRT